VRKLVLIILAVAVVCGSAAWLVGCQRPVADPGERSGSGPALAVPGDQYEPTEEELTWIEGRSREAGVYVKKFGDHFIVLIAMGERPTGGYAVIIDEIATSGDNWIVDVRFAEPEPGSMVTMALTYPYEIVKITDTGLGIKVRDITDGEPEELEITGE
jgi:hypothetical protein